MNSVEPVRSRRGYLALGLLAFALPASAAPNVFRINCGGDKFADDSGHIWQADANYQGGKSKSEWNDTYATQNKHLHLSWRYQDSLPMRYAFPVVAGNYKVRMHFSEHDTAVSDEGQRIFRVLANGKTVIDSLDIHKEAFYGTALVKEFIVASKNDSVVLAFAKLKHQPMVSGIEVYPEAWKDEPYPAVPPYRLACGGLGFTDPKGNVWIPDGAYGDGGRNSRFTGNIAKTDNPLLFLNERWDNSFSTRMTYAFPVPDDANYVVRLHFSETHVPTGMAGGRVFDIAINDSVVYPGMDIYSVAGFSTAFSIEFNAHKAADGSIHLGFISTKDAAKINGIEVFAGTAAVGILRTAAGGADAFRTRTLGRDRIRVEGIGSRPGSATLSDLRGRIHASRRVRAGANSIDFGGLRPGLYFLRIHSGSASSVHRIVLRG